MYSKNNWKTVLSIGLIILLLSCTSDDDTSNITRVLQDEEGLDIVLIWDPTSVNLDLFIQSVDTDDSESSFGSGTSESVDLNTSYPDGTYLVGVEFFNGESDATYSLTAQEKNSTQNVVEINGTIGPGTGSLIDREAFTIVKDGDTFEVRN